MPRGRKPSKRVKIWVEAIMSAAAFNDFKSHLKEELTNFVDGEVTYIAVDSEDNV